MTWGTQTNLSDSPSSLSGWRAVLEEALLDSAVKVSAPETSVWCSSVSRRSPWPIRSECGSTRFRGSKQHKLQLPLSESKSNLPVPRGALDLISVVNNHESRKCLIDSDTEDQTPPWSQSRMEKFDDCQLSLCNKQEVRGLSSLAAAVNRSRLREQSEIGPDRMLYKEIPDTKINVINTYVN